MEKRPGLSRRFSASDGGDAARELYAQVFASLRRSDQRRRAEQYVHGLLSVEGRKSMRGIAALVAGEGAEQSVHHFISSSTWQWQPVRRSLAQYLDSSIAPAAWVVRSVVIPKAGKHSVGVKERFVPSLGRVVNCQHALSVWLASEEAGCPVDWRLVLSDGGVPDDAPRRTAPSPGSGGWTPAKCAAEAVLDMAANWGITRRPVVFEERDVDVEDFARRLTAAGLSFVARISGATPLAMADARTADAGAQVPARRLVQRVKRLGRPVGWVDHTGSAQHTALAVTVHVTMPAVRRRPLLLLAEWADARRWPTRFWLTDITSASPVALLRLSRLIHRVDSDFAEVSDHVGMRDFEGRSYAGWHRHTTLASIAHAASMLRTAEAPLPPYTEERSA